MKYSKIIVAFIIIANVVFAGTVLYVFLKTSCEPSALVASWFAFTTGELWATASIRKKKAETEKHCQNETEVHNDEF